MSFLKNIIRNAVEDGIGQGVRNAVGKAAEKIVAPKAEAYANKVAESLDEATGEMESAGKEAKAERKSGFSSLEASLNRLSQSAEKYAAQLEEQTATRESLLKEWSQRVPEFPMWCFGGTDFWFDDNSNDSGTYYVFNVKDATPDGLELYVALLKKDGFVRKYASADEILYKDLGGEYLLFGCTDAFGTAPVMSVSMGRTKDRSEIEC